MGNVSIVIPTFNRPGKLDVVLPSYYRQEGVKELIVVDDGSTLDYATIISRHSEAARAHGVELRYIRLSSNRGAPVARQVGVDNARGLFTLMSEDDVLLSTGFVAHAVRCLQTHPGVGLVVCRVINLRRGESLEQALLRANRVCLSNPINARLLTGNFEAACPAPVFVPFGQSIGLWRQETLHQVKYFAGYRGNGYREETDPQVQALEAGFRVFYDPALVSFHLPHVDRGGHHKLCSAQAYYWTLRNNLIFLKRHLPFLRASGYTSHSLLFLELALAIRSLALLVPESLRHIAKDTVSRLRNRMLHGTPDCRPE